MSEKQIEALAKVIWDAKEHAFSRLDSSFGSPDNWETRNGPNAIDGKAYREVARAALAWMVAREHDHEKCIEENAEEFGKSLDQCLDRAERAEAERDRLRGEVDGLRLAYRYGTPFDPTGAKTGLEIQGLRADRDREREWAERAEALVGRLARATAGRLENPPWED